MIRVYNTKEDEVFNIPLTPEAARSPQILSSFMKRSQTLSHDPFFFYTAFHDSCGLSIRKKALSVVLAVGPKHFQSIRKGTCTPVYVPSKMSGVCHPQYPPPVHGQQESFAIRCQPEDLLSIDDQPKAPSY